MKRLQWSVRPLTLILLAINISLVAVALLRLVAGTQAAALLRTPPRIIAPPHFALVMPARVEALTAIQEAPLFYTSRRFFVPPPPPSQPLAPPAPEYRLTGTFKIPNKPAVASLAQNVTGAPRRVVEGDELEGWRVLLIERGRIVLGYAEQHMEIALGSKSTLTGLQTVMKSTPVVHSAPGGAIHLLGNGGGASAANNPARLAAGARLYRPPSP